MNLKTNELTEEIIELSRLLQKNLKHYFDRSTYCFVNFNILGMSDLGLIQIFYSEKSGFFSAKHQDKSIIRYAFGKYDKLNFQLAKDKSNPLQPLFIFDFPLDYSKKTYDAVFAKVNRQFHILSKIYNLSEKDIEVLNYSYKVYPLEGKDYALLDLGSFKHPKKFLKYLEEVVDELDFALTSSNELFIKPYSIKSITKRDSVDSKYKYCMVCGHKLENTINLNLLEFSRKFPARCESCLEKIYALDLYYKLDKNASSSKMIYLSDLKLLWDEEGLLGYNMKLLSKFEFLKAFHDDIYKLYPNEEIINLYSPLLIPIEEIEEEDDAADEELRRLLGLDEDEKKCKFCGKILDEDDGEDICSSCIHKQNAIPQIHKLLKYVRPGTAFTKSSIINKGLKSYDLDIICSYLVDLELLRDDMDDLLILESKSVLNNFIRQYSDDEEDLIQDDIKEVEKIKIKNSQLNEYSIDRAINLIDFIDNVECTYIREFDEWEVLFKRDGVEHTFQVYDNPFEAKLAAIKYLEKINVVEIVSDDDSLFYPDDEEESSTVEEEYLTTSTDIARICEVCDKEFIPRSKYNPDQKYCDECNSKYDSSEKQVLIGIKRGIYTEDMAIEIDNLLKQGYTKIKIVKKLGLKNSSLITPIIKFLLPKNISNEPSDITNTDTETEKKIKKCPICDKKVSNINKTYCDDCTEKYNTAQRKALIGIRNGVYNKKMAQEMQSLLDKGYSKTEVSKKYNISNTTYIDPIIDYLLDDYDFPFDIDSSKRCPICGNKVSRETKVYCDECTEKYSSQERRALVGINQGLFTKKLAREMLDLKKGGKNNSFIAKKVKLPDSHTPVGTSLVNPIIKFLLIDEVGEDLLISLGVMKKDSEVVNSAVEKTPQETTVPAVKTCLVCGKEFTTKCSNGSDMYCSECKSKYNYHEMIVHKGIRERTITKETAMKILELQNQGKNNKEITSILNLSHASIIPYIIRILLPDRVPIKEENYGERTNTCILCEQRFVPKSSNGSDKFCPECKKKHTTNELYVLLGVKEGKYTKELANQFIELQNDGLTNKKIGSKLGISPVLINPIIKYFENEEDEDEIHQEESEIDKTIYEFNETNGVIIFKNSNQWYIYHEKELISIFYSKEEAYKFWSDYLSSLKEDINQYKHLFESNGKIILKGIVSDNDYSDLFSFISILDCDLNKLTFNKLENEDYEIFIDFNLKDYDIPLTIRKLESLGWQKK